ncbi:MAG: DNA mismatch repair protein MutH [Polyangiales bacterium]
MRVPVAEPRSEEELHRRARALAGRTIGEVAAELGLALPIDTTRGKGFVGSMVERALGATAGSRSLPDFPALGVELKTIPVDPSGAPKESTFVCSIPLPSIAEVDFEHSTVAKKLERVLFVLVEAKGAELASRRIGTSFFWTPDETERRILADDYDALARLLAEGAFDRITAHLGVALQVRPKAANASIRRRGVAWDGSLEWTLPRGFYLRSRFTGRVIRRVLATVQEAT